MASSVSDYGDLGTTLGVVLRVARMHESPISVHDLLQLLPNGTRAEDVVTALQSSPGFASAYALTDGLIVPQSERHLSPEDYSRNREDSRERLETVKWLSSKVGDRNALTISVSGSTSYKAATKGEDVDLFCITARGTMWVFLAKALIFARVSRLLRRNAAPICLSCIMDEGYTRTLFAKDRGALFARDALVTEVVSGEGRYAELIDSAPWMEEYFPRLYALRRRTYGQRTGKETPVSPWLRFVNGLIFLTLGTYIRAKARYHNRILSRARNPLALFRARVAIDHLIYESAKYQKLRTMYAEISPSSENAELR